MNSSFGKFFWMVREEEDLKIKTIGVVKAPKTTWQMVWPVLTITAAKMRTSCF